MSYITGVAGNPDAWRHSLAQRGFVHIPGHALLTSEEHGTIASMLFAADALERDLPSVHPNRLRADDILRYSWREGRVSLVAAEPNHDDPGRIFITYPGASRDRRHYKRLSSLRCPPLHRLLTSILHLVPDGADRADGQVDVHAIRTYDVVVNTWHRDGSAGAPVDWTLSYVVAHRGAGAVSQLAQDSGGRRLVYEATLAPGDLLMHRDPDYFHYVTPLCPSPAEPQPERDALIIMVRPALER